MTREREAAGGIDIGSAKVAVVIADISGPEPVIIGYGRAENAGVRRGVVVDIDATARAITAAVAAAQRMAGTTISGAAVSVSGAHIACMNNRGVIAVTHPDKEIALPDVQRVLDAARVIHVAPDREVLQIIPREFTVDGYEGVRDPAGMVGSRLEVEAHIVTAATASVQNLLRAVARAEIEAEDVCISGLASAEAVLTPAERDLGALLCDIGAATMDLVLFDRGSPWFTSVVPVGGGHITSDISLGLRVPLPLAEQIKLEHARSRATEVPEGSFSIPTPSGRGTREVPHALLAEIVEPRVQELITLLAREIERSGFRGMIPGGVVLTGGGASLAGLADLISELLDMPCRIGTCRAAGSVAAEVSGPDVTTAVGLVRHCANLRLRGQAAAAQEGPTGFFGRLKGWLSDLF